MSHIATPHTVSPSKVVNHIHRVLTSDEKVQALIDLSFKDFHAKGLDYVCLHRDPETGRTLKAYFLNDGAALAPEVINPHDHRYAFRTVTLSGCLQDFRFVRDDRGEVFQAFDYMTPLNGGDGFTYQGDERLILDIPVTIKRGRQLWTLATTLHTIKAAATDTVLLLEQLPDTIALDKPTSCWTRNGSPQINTSGLYQKFTEKEFRARLKLVSQMVNRLPPAQA